MGSNCSKCFVGSHTRQYELKRLDINYLLFVNLSGKQEVCEEWMKFGIFDEKNVRVCSRRSVAMKTFKDDIKNAVGDLEKISMQTKEGSLCNFFFVIRDDPRNRQNGDFYNGDLLRYFTTANRRFYVKYSHKLETPNLKLMLLNYTDGSDGRYTLLSASKGNLEILCREMKVYGINGFITRNNDLLFFLVIALPLFSFVVKIIILHNCITKVPYVYQQES